MRRSRMVGGLLSTVMLFISCAGCGVGGDEAHDAAQQLMDAVVAGTVSSVQNLYTISDEQMPKLLDAKPKTPVKDVTVGASEKVSDSERSVPVTYSVDGKKTVTSFHVVKTDGKNWVVQDPAIFGKIIMSEDLTIGGKGNNGQNFSIPVGTYEVKIKSDLFDGAWDVPVKYSPKEYQSIQHEDYQDKIKLTDKILSYSEPNDSLEQSFNNLSMCTKLQKLYLNGQDFQLIVGKSISNACSYRLNSISYKITDFTADADDSGRYPVKFDATINVIAPEFKPGTGEDSDDWTCQSVQGGTQCARFINRDFKLEGFAGEVSQGDRGDFYFILADSDEATDQLANIIYAGHGVD